MVVRVAVYDVQGYDDGVAEEADGKVGEESTARTGNRDVLAWYEDSGDRRR